MARRWERIRLAVVPRMRRMPRLGGMLRGLRPAGPGRLTGWQRTVAAAVLGALLVGAFSVAATARVRGSSDRILTGVRIDGVDVGGMTRAEAVEAVAAHAQVLLDRTVTVVSAEKRWRVTPAQLGRRAEAERAVERALAGPSLSSLSAFWHKLTGRAVTMSVPLDYTLDGRRMAAFVRARGAELAVSPRDASIEIVDDRLKVTRSRVGRALEVDRAVRDLAAALDDDAQVARLPLERLAPAVPDSALGLTIAIDRSANRLTLYRGTKVVKSYGVATGTPGYPTPRGTWKVVNKRMNPTWVNPDPEGWGKEYPPFIPPGPGNPLGTRALDLDASGIRIHGTYAASSIGSRASHGCVRMHIADVEELYPMVPAGTPVLIFS